MNFAESDARWNDLQTWVNNCVDEFRIGRRTSTMKNFQAHLDDMLS